MVAWLLSKQEPFQKEILRSFGTLNSLCHCCVLCSGMPVSAYDVTMVTKRQSYTWGMLGPVGCPVRLVLGDSRLLFFMLYF